MSARTELPRADHQRVEVVSQIDLGGDAYQLKLAVPSVSEAAPGQFVMLRVTEGGDPLLGRPMAIYRLRRRRTRTFLEIIYRIVGRGTDLLSRVEAGRNLWMLGPLGGTFRLPGPGIRPLLVGGGTGIASLHFLAERLVVSPRSRQKTAREALSVLIGARTRKQLLCRPDFRSLGARITLATDDGSVGARGTVTDLLEKTLANGARSGRPIGLVYACGPTVMMETVAALCARTGVDCQVSLEGPMACGFGVCLGCAVPCKVDSPDAPVRSPRDRFKLICADGPVFDAATLAWGWES